MHTPPLLVSREYEAANLKPGIFKSVSVPFLMKVSVKQTTSILGPVCDSSRIANVNSSVLLIAPAIFW